MGGRRCGATARAGPRCSWTPAPAKVGICRGSISIREPLHCRSEHNHNIPQSPENAIRAVRLHEDIESLDRPADTSWRVAREMRAARTRVGRRGLTTTRISIERSSGNVFADIGFTPAETNDFRI